MKNTIIKFFIFIMLCSTGNAQTFPTLLSIKPDKLHTKSFHLTIEFNNSSDMKPFIAMRGKCLRGIRIQYSHEYWINKLKLPSGYDKIKEVVLISPNGTTTEFVAEFNDNGLRSILFSDDSLSYFMENIEGEDYFILGIVKNYMIIETIVIPLNVNGTKSFLNNCY